MYLLYDLVMGLISPIKKHQDTPEIPKVIGM